MVFPSSLFQRQMPKISSCTCCSRTPISESPQKRSSITLSSLECKYMFNYNLHRIHLSFYHVVIGLQSPPGPALHPGLPSCDSYPSALVLLSLSTAVLPTKRHKPTIRSPTLPGAHLWVPPLAIIITLVIKTWKFRIHIHIHEPLERLALFLYDYSMLSH